MLLHLFANSGLLPPPFDSPFLLPTSQRFSMDQKELLGAIDELASFGDMPFCSLSPHCFLIVLVFNVL